MNLAQPHAREPASNEAPSILGSSAATMVGTIASAALSTLYIGVAARWLGPERYGRVGAMLSLANLFFLTLNPLEAGLTLSAAQLAGQKQWTALAGFAARLFASMLRAGLLAVLAWLPLTWFLDQQTQEGASADLTVMGLFCAAAFITCGPRAVLRGRERFAALATNIVLESALRLSCGLALLWGFQSSASMIGGYALGSALALVHSAYAARSGLPQPEASREPLDLRLPFRSLSPALLSLNLYTAVSSNADVLAAAHFLPEHEAGLYAGGATVARMVQMGLNPLMLVLFSRLATLHAAREETSATLRRAALGLLALLAGSLLIPALAGSLLLELVLGSAFAAGAPVLLYQWAATCVLSAQLFLTEAMIATARVRLGGLLLLPSLLLPLALWVRHDSGLMIAQLTLACVAVVGSAACWLIVKAQR